MFKTLEARNRKGAKSQRRQENRELKTLFVGSSDYLSLSFKVQRTKFKARFNS